MHWQLTIYSVVLAFATCLALGVAVLALRYRDRPGGVALFATMFAAALWAGAALVEANATAIRLRVLWSQGAYIGALAVAPCLCYFAITLTQREHWRKPLIHAALWIIPAVTLLLVYTNSLHHLHWRDFSFSAADPRVLVYGRGPWFWVPAAHAYLVLLATTVFFAEATLRYRDVYRRRAVILLASLAPPWIAHLLYVLAPNVVNWRDWTPAAFAITGALLLWSLTRLHLFDLIPVARDRVMESLESGVIILDMQGRIVAVNPAAQQLIGQNNLIGRNASSVFAKRIGVLAGPEIGPQGVQPFWAAAPTGGEIGIAKERFLEWRVTPLCSHYSGRAGYLVFLHDITERRQAALALQVLNQTLEVQVSERTAEILAEQERSDAILRSVKDGILMTDRDRYIVYVNPAFTTLTGYTAEEVLARPAGEVVGDNIRRLMQATEARAEPSLGEAQLPRKDGRTLDVALTISTVRNQAGSMVGYVCTQHDISRLKDLERARKSFLDNISHQLRTPVTTLKLYTHLLSQTALSEEGEAYLQVIEGQTAWLSHLIQDILEVTALDAGQTQTARTPVALATLIDQLVNRYETASAKAGVQLVLTPLPADLPPLLGDQIRLVEALSEILDNAVHFTPSGGTITLNGKLEQRNGTLWVAVSVQDTGPGIPQNEQQRVFERFYRGSTVNTDLLPGTGLGLSIAQNIVRAHGGEITLRSSPLGTTFTVWLPAG